MAGSGGAQRIGIFKIKADGRTRLIVLDTDDLSLGRSPENDLAFDDPEMSRRHAVFSRTPEGCRLQDLGTPNGTDVNGQSMDHAQLASGDVVRVGRVEITYAETARDPESLGRALEYASQLKAFAVSLPEGDRETTMLGLSESPIPSGDADLDAALDLLGGDDLPALAAAPSADLSAPHLDVSRAVLPPVASAPSGDVWELDDEELGGLDLERPAGTGPLQLELEIHGLDGELRRALEALSGKTLDLARLRLKIRAG